MRKLPILLVISFLLGPLCAQEPKSSGDAGAKNSASEKDARNAQSYSGMYTFLREGEFVQVTVEDTGHVTGFVSRFGDPGSDKGEFLDQFFKTAKVEGSKLSFTTETVHGVTFDFNGTVERGEGKSPGDEAYYVLKGTLTQSVSDVNKKVTAHSQEVALKMFPQDTTPVSTEKK